MCHGKTGDADGPAVIELNIHPAKLSDPKLATESDGALFWKITTGKKPMPTYGERLSETWVARNVTTRQTALVYLNDNVVVGAALGPTLAS